MKFHPYAKGGGAKTFSRAEGGGATTSFRVVLRGSLTF